MGILHDVGDTNAYPPDQSRPKRALWMMQESQLSWNIHHVQYGPDKCQTRAQEGEVKGCQERSLPAELNKCFMNFKQLAVGLPAVLKDQRFREKTEYRLIKRNLHIFALIFKHVNLPPSLRSAFKVYCICLLCFFLNPASLLEQNILSPLWLLFVFFWMKLYLSGDC